MARLRLSEEADADLTEIDDYGCVNLNDEIAARYARGFQEVFAMLRAYPLSGAATPKYGKGIRCIVHRKQRIFYVVRDDTVLIVRIVHYARHAKRGLKWTA